MALKLRMACTFLNGCEDKQLNKQTHQIQKQIYDRGHMWPADPKILIIWPLTEKVCGLPALEDGH